MLNSIEIDLTFMCLKTLSSKIFNLHSTQDSYKIQILLLETFFKGMNRRLIHLPSKNIALAFKDDSVTFVFSPALDIQTISEEQVGKWKL